MLLIRGGYVWTGQDLLTDAAVLCRGDRIESVGDWSTLRASHPEADVVGGANCLVLPGLINAHHHGNGITSYMRGVADEALEPWLAALANSPSVDPYLDSLWAAIGLLEAGYTTVVLFQSTEDRTRAGEEARARIQACVDAGLRVALGLDLMQQNFYVYGPDPDGLPPQQGLSTGAYLDLLEELRRSVAREPLAQVFPAPSGPQWVSDEAWEAVGAWSKAQGAPLHTHCLESPYEAEYARRAYGSVVGRLDRLGALHQGTSLVHGVYLTPDELDLMSARGASLITNPGSNLRLRCGVSPVLEAMARGVRTALGTDGCTLGERDDAFGEMRLLFYLQRGRGIDSPALTWQDALKAATANAAAVTPWGEAIGGLRKGGLADASVFDFDAVAGPWTHPNMPPLQTMVQRAGRQHLHASVVGGRVAWEAGKGPALVNENEAAQKLQVDINARPFPQGPGWSDLVREFFRSWPIQQGAGEKR